MVINTDLLYNELIFRNPKQLFGRDLQSTDSYLVSPQSSSANPLTGFVANIVFDHVVINI